MTRRVNRPRGRYNRIAAICIATATMGAVGAASAQAAPSSGGGSSYLGPPSISDIQCRKGCVSQSQTQAFQTSGSLRVRRAGSLKVRGKNLAAVHKILFTGSSRPGDEFVVAPTSVGDSSLTVRIAGGTRSGQIKLIDEAGRKSKASRTRIKIMPRAIGGDPSGIGFIWPVNGMITGVFGENRGDHYHAGIDIAISSGTPIKAAAKGKVIFAGSAGGYGNMICLGHGTVSTCYAHQSRFADGIEEGSPVDQGGIIGYVGCTGSCTGPHVHFEVRQGLGQQAKPVDPMEYLPERGKAASARASAAHGHSDLGYSLPVHSFEDAH